MEYLFRIVSCCGQGRKLELSSSLAGEAVLTGGKLPPPFSLALGRFGSSGHSGPDLQKPMTGQCHPVEEIMMGSLPFSSILKLACSTCDWSGLNLTNQSPKAMCVASSRSHLQGYTAVQRASQRFNFNHFIVFFIICSSVTPYSVPTPFSRSQLRGVR